MKRRNKVLLAAIAVTIAGGYAIYANPILFKAEGLKPGNVATFAATERMRAQLCRACRCDETGAIVPIPNVQMVVSGLRIDGSFFSGQCTTLADGMCTVQVPYGLHDGKIDAFSDAWDLRGQFTPILQITSCPAN